MTEQELERRLKSALDAAAPDDFGDVLSRCEAGKGTVIDMKDMTDTGKKKTWKRSLIAACLALAVLAGGGGGFLYQQNHAVASIVSLDVNPSIELTVNKNEKVLTCKGLNADAAEVLKDMDGGHDLEGAKLDVAVNAIVGALVRNGYLDDLDSAILISVEDKDTARGERIQQELTQAVGGTLQSAANSAAVLTQSVAADTQLDTQAQQNNISTGKAYLVEQVLAINPDLAFEDLAALSVEELRDLIETGAPGMPIGKDAAAVAAEEWSGTRALDFIMVDVDPELDERTPCYEVELHTAWGEYEYRIDAYTGAVLSGKADILADAPSSEATPAPAEATSAPAESTPVPDTAQTYVGEDAVKAAVLARAGLTESEVTWIKFKWDCDDGVLEYDVEFRTDSMEYECTVDAATGDIREWDSEPVRSAMTGPGLALPEATPAPAEPTPAPETARTGDIGEAAAKAAALAQAGLTEDQITWVKVERDRDDGRVEYEVEFRTDYTKYDCTVDGTTGGILDWDADPAVIPAKSTPVPTSAPTATPTQVPATPAPTAMPTPVPDWDDDDWDDHDDDDDDDWDDDDHDWDDDHDGDDD